MRMNRNALQTLELFVAFDGESSRLMMAFGKERRPDGMRVKHRARFRPDRVDRQMRRGFGEGRPFRASTHADSFAIRKSRLRRAPFETPLGVIMICKVKARAVGSR